MVSWYVVLRCCAFGVLMHCRAGVPFNDTEHINIDIVTHGERILGDTVLGYQVSNEPDLYAKYVSLFFEAPLTPL